MLSIIFRIWGLFCHFSLVLFPHVMHNQMLRVNCSILLLSHGEYSYSVQQKTALFWESTIPDTKLWLKLNQNGKSVMQDKKECFSCDLGRKQLPVLRQGMIIQRGSRRVNNTNILSILLENNNFLLLLLLSQTLYCLDSSTTENAAERKLAALMRNFPE